MALQKDITLDNGIVLNYHRIVSLNTITNVQSIIEVASYVNEAQREKEKEAIETGTEMNVYIDTKYYNLDYSEETSVKTAYEYLKTLSEYKDAKDI